MTERPCHYCGAPARNGYHDIPSSWVCADCELVRLLHSGVDEVRYRVPLETRPEPLRRALAWERAHARRRTALQLLERRLRKLGVAVPPENGGQK